jgi:predicted kinase
MTEPTLRIVIGTAGSGKSTIAQRLAREYGAAYLDKDAMSARFVEAALLAAGYDPGDRESNAYYRERILPLEYDSLLDVAGANLRIGRPVVIDAPFSPYLSDPTFITAAADRFHWPPVDVEVVRVRVSPATLQHRLRERGLERDRVKLAHWDEYWATHGGLRCAWTGVRLSELSNDAQEAGTASDVPAPPVDFEHGGRGTDGGTR